MLNTMHSLETHITPDDIVDKFASRLTTDLLEMALEVVPLGEVLAYRSPVSRSC
jgi:hypothetical protein